jgi:rubredoxin
MCGWTYDPVEGVPSMGVEPGTPFEELPDDFLCPDCGAAKQHFSPVE